VRAARVKQVPPAAAPAMGRIAPGGLATVRGFSGSGDAPRGRYSTAGRRRIRPCRRDCGSPRQQDLPEARRGPAAVERLACPQVDLPETLRDERRAQQPVSVDAAQAVRVLHGGAGSRRLHSSRPLSRSCRVNSPNTLTPTTSPEPRGVDASSWLSDRVSRSRTAPVARSHAATCTALSAAGRAEHLPAVPREPSHLRSGFGPPAANSRRTGSYQPSPGSRRGRRRRGSAACAPRRAFGGGLIHQAHGLRGLGSGPIASRGRRDTRRARCRCRRRSRTSTACSSRVKRVWARRAFGATAYRTRPRRCRRRLRIGGHEQLARRAVEAAMPWKTRADGAPVAKASHVPRLSESRTTGREGSRQRPERVRVLPARHC